MNTKQEFIKFMNLHTEIALATCVNEQPSVRIVNFVFEEANNRILFTSFPDNKKVAEFEQNSKIAFTTIPRNEETSHIKGKGIVERSSRTIFDVEKQFTQKIAGYNDIIEQAGPYLVLFEIALESVIVTLDFEHIEVYDVKNN